MMTLDDTKLKAYLDDELSAPERAQVEQALTASPAAQERLAALRAQQAAVTARLDALTPTGTEQSPTRLALRRLWPGRPGRSRLSHKNGMGKRKER